MERRISSRAQVGLPVAALIDGFRHECRAVDLSPGGMVFLRSRGLVSRELSDLSPFELRLEGAWRRENLRAVAFLQRAKSLEILGAGAISLK